MATTDMHQEVTLPLVAVPGGVVFPGTVVTLTLDSDEVRAAVDAAQAADGRVLLVPRRDSRYAAVGVVAKVESVGELPIGARAAILRGIQRGRLGAAVAGERGGLWVHVTTVTEAHPTADLDAANRELRAVLQNVAELRGSRRLPELLRTINDPGQLADAVTAWSEVAIEQQIDVLEAVDVADRVDLVLAWAKEHVAELQVARQIRDGVAGGMERQQREYLLRQQLQAIRKELGEDGDDAGDDYRRRLDELALPAKVRAAVDKELERLERMSPQSPEQGWIRTWLDRVLDLPWGITTQDRLDLVAARAVLDADHEGLDDVKDRIVELLAVRKLRAERNADAESDAHADTGSDAHADGGADATEAYSDVTPAAATAHHRGDGAILALVGPPGVGKTSLGESVARAMGRAFVRVALGGVRDEAEIRGHRRTYVGAQPGRIARAITEAGTMNPVVLLDEVDKLSAGGWSGDPTAALLEVLDPAQNHTFRDHYLEVELDLSDVLFIATANVLDTIPGPLLDRMELVRLDGYTEDEKVVIARHHLLARQLARAGLRAGEVELDDATIQRIIIDYTREAGVRTLERELAKLLRKVATRVAGGTPAEAPPTVVRVTPEDLATYLGRPKFHDEVAERTDLPGVATGLAVTGTGGDVLFVEASASEGEPGLTLTGQLGDVMKESAQIALSFVRAHAAEYQIDPAGLGRRIHVHVPAGAVPKDGPSAGVTMTTALVSLLTGRRVRSNVGMTGEVTLQGKVLPIGGVKQKVLAAHRAGLTEVILPRRNGPDLDDVPERVRAAITFHLADTVDDVLSHALMAA